MQLRRTVVAAFVLAACGNQYMSEPPSAGQLASCEGGDVGICKEICESYQCRPLAMEETPGCALACERVEIQNVERTSHDACATNDTLGSARCWEAKWRFGTMAEAIDAARVAVDNCPTFGGFCVLAGDAYVLGRGVPKDLAAAQAAYERDCQSSYTRWRACQHARHLELVSQVAPPPLGDDGAYVREADVLVMESNDEAAVKVLRQVASKGTPEAEEAARKIDELYQRRWRSDVAPFIDTDPVLALRAAANLLAFAPDPASGTQRYEDLKASVTRRLIRPAKTPLVAALMDDFERYLAGREPSALRYAMGRGDLFWRVDVRGDGCDWLRTRLDGIAPPDRGSPSTMTARCTSLESTTQRNEEYVYEETQNTTSRQSVWVAQSGNCGSIAQERGLSCTPGHWEMQNVSGTATVPKKGVRAVTRYDRQIRVSGTVQPAGESPRPLEAAVAGAEDVWVSEYTGEQRSGDGVATTQQKVFDTVIAAVRGAQLDALFKRAKELEQKAPSEVDELYLRAALSGVDLPAVWTWLGQRLYLHKAQLAELLQGRSIRGP